MRCLKGVYIFYTDLIYLQLLHIAVLFFFEVRARQYVVMLVWEFIYAYVLWHFRSDEEV